MQPGWWVFTSHRRRNAQPDRGVVTVGKLMDLPPPLGNGPSRFFADACEWYPASSPSSMACAGSWGFESVGTDQTSGD